jgi:hypothetical protein
MQTDHPPEEQKVDEENGRILYALHRLDAIQSFLCYLYFLPFTHPLKHPDVYGKICKWAHLQEMSVTDRNSSLKDFFDFSIHITSV